VKSLTPVIIFLAMLVLQIWLVVWVAKRVLKRSRTFQRIRAAAEQARAQTQAQAPTQIEGQKLALPPAAEGPKQSAEGFPRETLEESLAKHRKQVAEEVALLQQYQEKGKK
jgi:hypothetical protein